MGRNGTMSLKNVQGLRQTAEAGSKKTVNLEQLNARGRRLMVTGRANALSGGKVTMVAEETKSGWRASGRAPVELGAVTSAITVGVVDHWHKQWQAVLEFVQSSGHHELVAGDANGWLSARKCVLAAFVEGRVAGFLAFHVVPVMGEFGVELFGKLDALVVRAGEKSADEIERELLERAGAHARDVLQCRSLQVSK